jgi:hypothetical protein
MDATSLMISLFFGAIGTGMFMYGKKAERMIPLAAGVALIVVPYFIPNAIVMLIVCCLFTAAPWLLRNT